MKSLFSNFIRRISYLIHSIRFRLALWFVVILGIVICLFSVFIYTRQSQDLRKTVLGRLEIKEHRLGEMLGVSGHEDTFRGLTSLTTLNSPDGEAIFTAQDIIVQTDTNGRVILSSGPIADNTINQLLAESSPQTQRAVDPSSDMIFTAMTGTDGKTPYVFSVSFYFTHNGPAGMMIVGSPLDPDNQLPRLMFSLLFGILLTLGTAFVGGFWIADRAMRPVKQITQAAKTIGETDLSRRINIEQKDEIGELASTFDEMLSRLQAAFERQRQFTADASHELRTPLTIIDLETNHLLSSRRSAQETNRALNVIHSENQFMIRLINNLLSLARMDAGQVTLQQTRQEFSGLVLEVVDRLAPLAGSSGVNIILDDLPDLNINGDRSFLIQMLSNLIENAIKYAAVGGKLVTVVGERKVSGDTHQAWLRITDNGPGIPQEHLPYLFERFYQVEKARTRSVEKQDQSEQAPTGTGLGLSIALWIARAHHGDIKVFSQEGSGTTFEVTIPLADDQPELAFLDFESTKFTGS